MERLLELRQLRLKPHATPFDCRFEPGRINVLLGANFAGKSDLCRSVAGLSSRARCERLTLHGKDIGATPTRQRPVALVTQAFVNYPNWTVAGNIASPLRARRDSAESIAAQVHRFAAALGLEDLLERFPHELSGGQQQRVALARALAKQADVLLLDEPLVNLDYKLREAMQDELRALLRDGRTIVIYATSEPREAFALGDQVLLLDAGNLLQSGSALDVYRQPVSLAAMDLMSEPRANRTSTGAIRPEHVSLRPFAGATTFVLDVSAVETNGSESFIHGTCEGREWVVREAGIVTVRPGESVASYVRDQDVQAFGA